MSSFSLRRLRHFVLRLSRDQSGVAAVEFAFVAPCFIALILGIVDIGRFMWTWNTVQYAVDTGVRAGVVGKLTEDQVKAVVTKHLTGLDANLVNIDPDKQASQLVINATTTYNFIFPISVVLKTTQIKTKSVMPM